MTDRQAVPPDEETPMTDAQAVPPPMTGWHGWQAVAARDNAAWCDLMCRAHGRPGTFTERSWTNPARTPPFYPDAVTLSPDATAADVLGRIDAGPGASVKDSFATLDLPGFEVLFEARWIHRAAPDRRPTDWARVEDAATLRDWERAFGEPGLFPPALLAEATIVYGRTNGEITTGAVLTTSATGPAVGVSNVFGPDEDAAWQGTLAMAAELFPGRPLVGYEIDPTTAMSHGFTTTGPLRVWIKP
ncbi:hypothetical protein AB0C27_19905 [Nonomuraea sp. NPDC048882]|uniref:hypothetical protein n=1 Tax=unclassified Nonomuraea TaxID=2593643 RepID=UPI0033F38AD9